MKYDDKTKLLSALSKRIKELRNERGLSQEDCLNDTGILFSRIELGSQDIFFTTLHKICKYFGITLKEFFNSQFEELN